MIIEHVGLSEIKGSLVVLDGVEDASFEEIVKLNLDNGSSRMGRIVQIDGQCLRAQLEFRLQIHAQYLLRIRWSWLCRRRCSAEYSMAWASLPTAWAKFSQKCAAT